MSEDLATEVAILRAQIEYLTDRIGDEPGLGARPVNWTALTADAAAEAWAALARWVDWLLDRYALAETIPGCWYAHPVLLEELSAIHVAWLGAYCDPAASAVDGVLWHDMLDRVVVRIRDHDVASCASAAEHRAELAGPIASGTLSERAEAIRADIASRPTSVPHDCGQAS